MDEIDKIPSEYFYKKIGTITMADVYNDPPRPAAAKILEECIDLMVKKNRDYNNPHSSVKQAMHYRRGIDTIHDMIHQKVLRAQSLIEGDAIVPANESLEDTYRDLINYAAFAVLYLRGEMDGQDPNRDVYNRKKS